MSSPSGPISHRKDFRPLSELEGELIAVLLSADFSGRDALVEQVTVAYVHQIDDNGSLEFAPFDKAPAEVIRRIPTEAEIKDNDGVTIHLLLHVVDGFLKELEVYRDDSARVQRVLAPEGLCLISL